MQTRQARAEDTARIAEIYNQGIADRTATFETEPRTPADLARRVADERHPNIVVVGDDGRILGWAGISEYRPRPCYAGVAEFSVYIDRAARGQGVGRRVLEALIAKARALGYWKLLSRVFPFNQASLALCRACGFRVVGTYENHARLEGRWLDVVIVERLIPENQEV